MPPDAGRGELFRALAAAVEEPSTGLGPLSEALELGDPPTAAEHADLFLFQFYPFASVYLGAEGGLGGEARDRLAGFWRALGVDPAPEPDELSLLLASYGGLVDRAADDPRWGHARKVFFWEHLASWLPIYLQRVKEVASGYYRSWAACVGQALRAEAADLGPEPDPGPSALRVLPRLADPREVGSEPFVTGLLAPAVSGVIWVRDDLAMAARELGLGLRVGERRWVLKALLAQQPSEVLAWLSRRAGRQTERYQAALPVPGPGLVHWQARATATANLLRALAAEATDHPYNPAERSPE